MRILLAIVLNAVALGAAAFLIDDVGVQHPGNDTLATILAYLFVGAVFGVVNVVIKPIVQILALPITCLTLGLFAIVINALMLLLTSWLTSWTPATFEPGSFFWDTVLAAIIVSIVSALLNRWVVRPTTG